jgi:hypothetical protein
VSRQRQQLVHQFNFVRISRYQQLNHTKEEGVLTERAVDGRKQQSHRGEMGFDREFSTEKGRKSVRTVCSSTNMSTAKTSAITYGRPATHSQPEQRSVGQTNCYYPGTVI